MLDDDEEEKEENEEEKKNEDKSSNKFQFVVEIYNPARGRLKLRKQIPLLKDKDNPLLKSKLLLRRASFATNGKLVLMSYRRTMHFFDIATGIRLSKSKLKEEIIINPDQKKKQEE